MKEDEFEWDPAKAESNLAKHGVNFDRARLVFEDFFAYEHCHFDSASGEIRTLISGDVNGGILTVVYTERGDRIRIISARKATTNERNRYYRGRGKQ